MRTGGKAGVTHQANGIASFDALPQVSLDLRHVRVHRVKLSALIAKIMADYHCQAVGIVFIAGPAV
jgi:hypothetical protein